MTDKVQKIRKEVERMHNLLPVMDGDNISINYADRICTTLKMYIDSLQEELVSEGLEEEVDNYVKRNGYDGLDSIKEIEYIANHFAKWQEEQMMKDAYEYEVKVDAGGYPYIPQIELYDYEKDEPLAEKGDIVRVMVIKK